MTSDKDTGLINFGDLGLDPAVKATVTAGAARAADRGLSPTQRRAKSRERTKQAARRGARASYDLPPELIQAVATLAADKKTPASQLAALALSLFLAAVERGEIDLTDYLQPIINPRYSYVVKLPDEK